MVMVHQQICLVSVHISNVKSIRECEIGLRDSNYVFGINNSGKSNLIFALNAAFGNTRVGQEDIFVSESSPFDGNKKAIIDLMFRPTGDDGFRDVFSDEWQKVLGDSISLDYHMRQFFAFRTEFEYDGRNNSYRRKRSIINDWSDKDRTHGTIPDRIMSRLNCLYLDAHRDISEDIGNRTSFWNKRVSDIDISEDLSKKIEHEVMKLNEEIINGSNLLMKLKADFNDLPMVEESVEIKPMSNPASRVYGGLEVNIDISGNKAPISALGLGSRSVFTISTVKTVSNAIVESGEPEYTIVLIEEPEAHLHPMLQTTVGGIISQISVQKIVTTHSANILNINSYNDMIHAYREGGETKFTYTHLEPDEERTIRDKTHGKNTNLLFSKLIIFGEGWTEEVTIPIYLKHLLGKDTDSLDVMVVGTGGKNSYTPFLKLAHAFGLKWLIFSDGDKSAPEDVSNSLKDVFGDSHDVQKDDRVIIIPGMRYEDMICADSYDVVYMAMEDELGQEAFEKKLREKWNNIPDANDSKVLADLIHNSKHSMYAADIAERICNANSLSEPIKKLADAVKRELRP